MEEERQDEGPGVREILLLVIKFTNSPIAHTEEPSQRNGGYAGEWVCVSHLSLKRLEAGMVGV